MKRYKFVPAALVICLLLCGCSPAVSENKGDETGGVTGENNDIKAPSDTAGNNDIVTSIDPDDVFSARDLETDYDEDGAVRLTLSEGENLITEAGVYVLSGNVKNGSVKIEADKSDKIQLVLDGVDITNEGSAALYVKSADKVFVTLARGSENFLSSKGEFSPDTDAETGDTVNVDGAIFSREDITFNGEGKLTVSSEKGDGIVSKDDLKITGGEFSVSAPEGHALSGKDCAAVAGGTLTLVSGKDGIRSENDDDAERGNVVITGGRFDITADGDGIYAGREVNVSGGEIKVTAGGGSKNGEQHTGGMWGGFSGFGGSADTSDDTVSQKGIKGSAAVAVSGGVITVDTADDAVHSDGNVNVSGGEISISSGDDGIHADGSIVISGGSVDIKKSYEGIEGKTITVSDGEVSIVSDDDGFNASDGTGDTGGMFGGGRPGAPSETESGTEVYLLISGGRVYVNASGDGLDSNGALFVEGGETYVDGPTNSGNGALDYATEGKITGGVVVAVGASGMAENFGSSSTQGAIMYNVGSSDGGKVTLTDENGDVLAEFQPAKSYNSVVISAPGIKEGGEYTLLVGGNSYEIKMTSLIYGEGGGFGGGGPGGGGGRPGGFGGPGGRR